MRTPRRTGVARGLEMCARRCGDGRCLRFACSLLLAARWAHQPEVSGEASRGCAHGPGGVSGVEKRVSCATNEGSLGQTSRRRILVHFPARYRPNRRKPPKVRGGPWGPSDRCSPTGEPFAQGLQDRLDPIEAGRETCVLGADWDRMEEARNGLSAVPRHGLQQRFCRVEVSGVVIAHPALVSPAIHEHEPDVVGGLHPCALAEALAAAEPDATLLLRVRARFCHQEGTVLSPRRIVVGDGICQCLCDRQ